MAHDKRLICIMPIYKRPEITRLAVKCLQKQTVPFYRIVLVGSAICDERIAEKCGVEYIQYSNDFLSRKYQAGVYYAKKYNPYAVVIADSDDLISPTWNETLLRECEGYDLLGARELLMLDYAKKQLGKLYKVSYLKSDRFYGPGKSFTREYLNKMNWKVYNTTISYQCDGETQKIATEAGARIKTLHDIILSVKGDWDMIDSLKQIKASNLISITMNEIPNVKKYLQKHFPLALELLT